MKFKATKKQMRENYHHIIHIGYCNGQHLLGYENAIAYSARAEGWACDYYDVNGILISTGYAPLNDKNAKASYDLIKSYDDKAAHIAYGNNTYEEKQAAVRVLLSEFVKEAISE